MENIVQNINENIIIDKIRNYFIKFQSPIKLLKRTLDNKIYTIKNLSTINNLNDFLELMKTIYIVKSTCVYFSIAELDKAKEYYNNEDIENIRIINGLSEENLQIYVDLKDRLNNPEGKFYKYHLDKYIFKKPNPKNFISELANAVQYSEICNSPTISRDIPSIDKLKSKFLKLLPETKKDIFLDDKYDQNIKLVDSSLKITTEILKEIINKYSGNEELIRILMVNYNPEFFDIELIKLLESKELIDYIFMFAVNFYQKFSYNITTYYKTKYNNDRKIINSKLNNILKLYEIEDFNVVDTLKHIPNNYLLLKYIGKGGYGIVFKAINRNTYEIVVLKITTEKNMIEREIYGLIKCTHPNLMCLKEYINNEKYNIYVMDYIEGVELSYLILNYRRKIESIIDICSAIKYLHDNKIVHLDIKPNNILYTYTGKTILFDFGLSCIYDNIFANETHHSNLFCGIGKRGTKGFIAPEVLSGHKITTASDIYSLGVLFYIIFNDYKALPDNYSKSKKLINVPINVNNMIFKMLSKNPEDRPTIKQVYKFFISLL